MQYSVTFISSVFTRVYSICVLYAYIERDLQKLEEGGGGGGGLLFIHHPSVCLVLSPTHRGF